MSLSEQERFSRRVHRYQCENCDYYWNVECETESYGREQEELSYEELPDWEEGYRCPVCGSDDTVLIR